MQFGLRPARRLPLGGVEDGRFGGHAERGPGGGASNAWYGIAASGKTITCVVLTGSSMAVLYTITVNEDITPLDGADVWVTTDSGGADTVASGVTNALGQKSFTLDLGSYYVWAQRAGTDIINPTAITVTVSGSTTITGTPASGGNYITVAGLKSWLGITGSDVDTLLTEVVSGCVHRLTHTVDADLGERRQPGILTQTHRIGCRLTT